MQLYFASCGLCQIIYNFQRAIFYINTFLKLRIIKNTIKCLFIVVLALYFTAVHSKENTSYPKVSIEPIHLSEEELISKASDLRRKDPKASAQLANQSLQSAKEKNNLTVTAQALSLLGELNKQSKDIEQSKQHYLQASIIYKEIGDIKNQIITSVDYINLLITEKKYDEAYKQIDELMLIAKQYDHPFPLALIIIIKGDAYYEQKKYRDAINQFTGAVEYLSESNKTVQKKLGETYKKIAQSYKRLSSREETAAFYKKTLDVFIALKDKKNTARTLNTLAEAERYLGHYEIALDYSIRGLELHKRINDPVGQAKALMGAGIIYRHINDYRKSLANVYEAHKYYKQVHDATGIAKTSNEMGLLYTNLKEFGEARSFYQLTIDLPEEKVDPKTLATALREMAVIDIDFGNYESAKIMAHKAHQIYISLNQKSNQSLITRIIGNIYRAEGNDTEAISYYRESLVIAINIGSEIYQIKAQIPLGGILTGKNTEEAIYLLKSSLALSTKLDLKTYQQYAYRDLRIAEKLQGNITASLNYAEKEIALTELIQKEREDNELVLAKAKLYSHKKEMELASLKEKSDLDELELAKKTNEIQIATQTIEISELELTKNKYASFTLVALLVLCLLAVIFIYRQFINSRKRNKELDYLVARDPLTNCYNRRILCDVMSRDFIDLTQLKNYCIIMVDIDHFKKVNDNYGHNTGDTVLIGIANILQQKVGQNDITVRYGGEEFCIVLPESTREQAMQIAEKIRIKVEMSNFGDVAVTCSLGVTSIEFEAKSPSELIEQADLALYKSKANGRNQVTLWDNTIGRENTA